LGGQRGLHGGGAIGYAAYSYAALCVNPIQRLKVVEVAREKKKQLSGTIM
jgi:hypothetical protein